MKAMNRTPIILFLFAVALPACEVDIPAIRASHGSLVEPPASCDNGDPTCNVANDFPGPGDIDPSNSLNLVWSPSDNALILTEGSAQILDTDADGVPDASDECPGPGWRAPCDGDASNDGIYFTLEYDLAGAVTGQSNVEIEGSLRTIDSYILIDTSAKMSKELDTIRSELTTGTFGDTSECPEAVGAGLVGAIKCLTPNARFGVGEFGEIPLLPHATPYSQTPYHHYLDFTRNLTHLTDAISLLRTRSNKDSADAATQAFYSILTGQGLGPYVPNRAGCPPNHWGYPCFRDLSLPVIMLFTDGPVFNGPRAGGKTYGNPPFDGVLGASALLPPVQMSPNVLYANDPTTAWDLGDLTSTSMTVMGSNTNFANNALTSNLGACRQCTDPTDASTCWTDGRDAFVKFSLSAMISPFLSGQGTAYPTHNVAVFDATPAGVDCDPGPGGGDYWGQLTPTLAAGDYYLASDAAVPLGVSSTDVEGPYQLRIQTTPSDPSWATADLPVPWTNIEPLFLSTRAKIVAILSESPAQQDMLDLARTTESVDDDGNEYVNQVSSSGAGISDALVDALDLLVNNTRRDITLVAEDVVATAAVDESLFLNWAVATACPTGAEPNCTGGVGTAVCTDCLNGAQMAFEFELGNTFVTPGYDHQIFDFDLIALADGAYELTRTPVRVMVPKGGPMYGSGHYENTYDASTVCEMPPDVPDWGTLAWTASTPSDSNVEFIVYTANTLEDLDTATPVSLVPPVGVTSLDVADELQATGEANNMPYLRIRAIVNGSTDNWNTPVFSGWTMEFNCVPFD